jgi:hypothetical protein
MLAFFVAGRQMARFGTEVVIYEMVARLLILYQTTTKHEIHSQQKLLNTGYFKNTAPDMLK